MGKNERDGLRVFAVDELCELLRIGFVQNIERGDVATEDFHQAVVNIFRSVRTESHVQHFFGVLETAFSHIFAAHNHLIKLFEHAFGLLRRDILKARNLAANQLNLVVAKRFHQL